MGYTPWNLKVGHDLVTQQQQQHTLWCRKLNLGVSQGAQWVKEPACNAGDMGLIPVLGRSPRGWQGNPLQYSFLENPDGQRSLGDYSPCGRRVGHEWVTKHTHTHTHAHTHSVLIHR